MCAKPSLMAARPLNEPKLWSYFFPVVDQSSTCAGVSILYKIETTAHGFRTSCRKIWCNSPNIPQRYKPKYTKFLANFRIL